MMMVMAMMALVIAMSSMMTMRRSLGENARDQQGDGYENDNDIFVFYLLSLSTPKSLPMDDNDDEESQGKCAGINKGDERRDREAAAPFISKQLPSSPCLLLLCRIHTILLDLPLLVAVKWNTQNLKYNCVNVYLSKMSSCETL